MITLTEPQIWTLIGVFAAMMLGGMTLMTTLLMRTITTSVDGLRAEMGAKFETMEARFGTVDVKLEHLDRDVHAISRRVSNGDAQ